MEMIKKTKCCNCGRLFLPDCRNRNRQKYCREPECRKASKVASQRKWLKKPENKSYFKGPENIKRVQEWRKQNPGYWRRNRPKRVALQDCLNEQPAENNEENGHFTNNALQDFLTVQPALIIGLISSIIGSPLQDDIDQALHRMQQFGQDILYRQPKAKGGQHDDQVPNFTWSGPQGSPKLQLDRSPADQ